MSNHLMDEDLGVNKYDEFGFKYEFRSNKS